MTLKDIVAYINLLDSIGVGSECNGIIKNLDSLLHLVVQHPAQLNKFSTTLTQNFELVTKSVTDFSDTISQLREKLQSDLDDAAPEYFRESQRWFDHEQPFESNEYILNRRLGIDDHSNILLRSHLRNYSDWRLPGLMFRPGRESFIEEMVPLDPLYLVDQHEDLLKPSVGKFTPEYQRRLREYVVNDHVPTNFLTELPNNQFGVIFAYNYFNYKPIDIIKRYLDELFLKLRSGGVLIMTYNNCDRAQGVGLAERCFMSYTPKKHIVKYAESIGFELVFSHDGDGDLSWIEFRRLGQITSLRGGQTLARIVAQSK